MITAKCVQETEIYLGFWWGNLNAKDHFEELGRDRSTL